MKNVTKHIFEAKWLFFTAIEQTQNILFLFHDPPVIAEERNEKCTGRSANNSISNRNEKIFGLWIISRNVTLLFKSDFSSTRRATRFLLVRNFDEPSRQTDSVLTLFFFSPHRIVVSTDKKFLFNLANRRSLFYSVRILNNICVAQARM